jgi:signal transduction histidine kinase
MGYATLVLKKNFDLERSKTEQKNKELHELNATKDKFFSIISHDLKSPFNSIIGFSNLLIEQVKEKDYEGIEAYAKYIQDSSQRAMNLLLNLLEWSRSQTGRMEYNPEYVEIDGSINEVIELLSDSAQQKSITIHREFPPNMIAFIDKAMISTILRNLISNAIKFTNPGGEIIISVMQNQKEMIVSVADNGVGIRPMMIDKLFRIDESSSTSGTQDELGTGLGLILCKEFVEKHGGNIRVESDPDGKSGRKGSKFSFTIPKS